MEINQLSVIKVWIKQNVMSLHYALPKADDDVLEELQYNKESKESSVV